MVDLDNALALVAAPPGTSWVTSRGYNLIHLAVQGERATTLCGKAESWMPTSSPPRLYVCDTCLHAPQANKEAIGGASDA